MNLKDESKLSDTTKQKMKESKGLIVHQHLMLLRLTFEDPSFAKEHNKDKSPLDWWKNEKSLITLHNFARMQLSTMSSSAPVERFFKIASRFSSNDRPLLSTENIEMQAMIVGNYHLIEKYSIAELLDMILEMKETKDDFMKLFHSTDLGKSSIETMLDSRESDSEILESNELSE